MTMTTLENMLSEQLNDDEFRNEYEAIQPEMDVIRAAADALESRVKEAEEKLKTEKE